MPRASGVSAGDAVTPRTVKENGPGPVAGHARICNAFYDDHLAVAAPARPRLRRQSPARTIPSLGADVDP